MPVFTCLSEIRESFHVTQHVSVDPEAALRSHILQFPYDDGDGPSDDELEWLLRVGDGREPIELVPVSECRGTWLWASSSFDGLRVVTYIVRTELG